MAMKITRTQVGAGLAVALVAFAGLTFTSGQFVPPNNTSSGSVNGPAGGGTLNDIAIWAGANSLGNYGGTTACAAGQAITVLSATGAATCAAFSTITNSSTINQIPKTDASGNLISTGGPLTESAGAINVNSDALTTSTGNLNWGNAITANPTNGNVSVASGGGVVTDNGKTTVQNASGFYVQDSSAPTASVRLVSSAGGNFIQSGTSQSTSAAPLTIASMNGVTSYASWDSSGNLTTGNNLTVTGTSTLNGAVTVPNAFSQTGANTFSTGTGAVSLNGNTTVTSSGTFASGTGAVTLNGATTINKLLTVTVPSNAAFGALFSDSGTSQTVAAPIVIYPNSNGSFDTSAGAITNQAVHAEALATRAAGANNLTNVALYGTAANGQISRALQTDSGDVLLNNSSGILSLGGNVNTVGPAAGAPTSCGTGPAFAANSPASNTAGRVTTGTTNTGCTIPWSATRTKIPACICMDETLATRLTGCTPSATNLVITLAANSSDVISYICFAGSGGT